MVFSNDFDIVFVNDFLIKYSDTYYESYNSSARVQNLFVYVFIAYGGVLKNKKKIVYTITVLLSLSLHCLSCRNVTEYHTMRGLKNNKTVLPFTSNILNKLT